MDNTTPERYQRLDNPQRLYESHIVPWEGVEAHIAPREDLERLAEVVALSRLLKHSSRPTNINIHIEGSFNQTYQQNRETRQTYSHTSSSLHKYAKPSDMVKPFCLGVWFMAVLAVILVGGK